MKTGWVSALNHKKTAALIPSSFIVSLLSLVHPKFVPKNRNLTGEKMNNEYLQQVINDQEVVERSLKKRKSSPQPSKTEAETPNPNYRITGFWRFKNVIVPPNVYVVHTRRGQSEPLDMGLGVSFRYDPLKDSFLVVPSAMQTIVVNANCISRERQGILVQSYVQWIIDDFKTAYQKLDFSDPYDPMSVVNLQLKEQTEAVIKDTVATMNIDNILSDKKPIIEELTARLRELADGLGLKIVTVQIKEAVVSSTKLGETLQRPFRAERSKDARLAELKHKAVVEQRENEAAKATALLRIEREREIEARKAEIEAQAFDQAQNERLRRARLEAEALEEATAHKLHKIQAEAKTRLLSIEQDNKATERKAESKSRLAEQELRLERLRQEIRNQISPIHIQEKLVASLPEIVGNMPTPNELKSISLGNGQLDDLLNSVGKMVERIAK
jgi:regulator of protease activity HflC (stomatin/prohibitin superfamily)